MAATMVVDLYVCALGLLNYLLVIPEHNYLFGARVWCDDSRRGVSQDQGLWGNFLTSPTLIKELDTGDTNSISTYSSFFERIGNTL